MERLSWVIGWAQYNQQELCEWKRKAGDRTREMTKREGLHPQLLALETEAVDHEHRKQAERGLVGRSEARCSYLVALGEGHACSL